MRLKFIIPIVIIGAAAVVFTFEAFNKNDNPPEKQDAVVVLVGQILKNGHYDPKKIDDKFSREVYHKYLDDLDKERKFFLQSDILYLNKYENQIDDEINGTEPLDFLKDADSIYQERFLSAEKIYPQILSKPFNFDRNDSIQLDRSKSPYASNEKELYHVWDKMLKYRTLEKLVELESMQKSAPDTAAIKKESAAQLEKDARKQVKRIYDLFFDRMKTHYTEKERFNDFVNAITGSMDPHTDYMAPTDKRYFDEQMSGTFYGIGALLRQDDDKVKIESIVSGGPAWKQGQIKAGDIILKVGQGDKEPIDLTGYTTEDAVKLIRGAKGTIVKLTVKHIDGTIQTIPIVRGVVKIEETFAHSYIINGPHKIGVIVLPEFYFNPKGTTGPGSSAYDVANEVQKLKDAHVQGIILDLRYNGGGSLGDAVDMAGLFVPHGPVVQVRSRSGDVEVLKCHNDQVEYSGPLAVMVNEYSASASEILTAAMQDYKRAVIIGSPSTYGKGTVQRMFELDDFLSPNARKDLGDLGAIKLTIQKFYRINGGSTQLKGVTPDIILKDPYYDVAEREDTDALPWDQIKRADYNYWSHPVDVSYLKKLSANRVEKSEAFKLIDQNLQALKRVNEEKKLPLNLVEYKALQQKNDDQMKQIDKVKDVLKPLKVSNLATDTSMIHSDSLMADRNREILKAFREDPYLNEAVNVVDDMIKYTGASIQTGRLSVAK